MTPLFKGILITYGIIVIIRSILCAFKSDVSLRSLDFRDNEISGMIVLNTVTTIIFGIALIPLSLNLDGSITQFFTIFNLFLYFVIGIVVYYLKLIWHCFRYYIMYTLAKKEFIRVHKQEDPKRSEDTIERAWIGQMRSTRELRYEEFKEDTKDRFCSMPLVFNYILFWFWFPSGLLEYLIVLIPKCSKMNDIIINMMLRNLK